MYPSIKQTEHRPWDLPSEPWQWRQCWYDLAFFHYRIEAETLRGLLPAGLEIDSFDGSAWISVVPFMMEDVMRGKFPSVYPLRKFPELNLRTYVKRDGKSGVFFFSLDAACLPLVTGARLLFGLPYHQATMRYESSDEHRYFTSNRWVGDVTFEAEFQEKGEAFLAEKDSFEHWVTERYCLYSAKKNGKLCRLEVHHKQWPLQQVEFDIRNNDTFKAAGLTVDESTVIGHFSKGVEVVTYKPEWL